MGADSQRNNGAAKDALDVHPEELGIGSLFEKVRDAVVVAEAKSGRVVLWNPAAEEVFGYPPSEALTMRVEELVPRYLKDRHQAGINRYGRTGSGPHVDSRSLLELPAVKKGGEEIWVELSLNPIEAEGAAEGEAEGGRRYVLAIVRDVTRRKRAEEALRESEERTRGLADAAFEGILISDEGQILEVNRALLGMFGYEEHEVVGRSALQFVAPEYRDLVRRNLLSDHEEPYEIVGLDRAGGRVDLEVRGRAFSYEGRPVRVTALRDVTERKRAEEFKTRLAAIVDSSDDAIISKTLEGTITSWNRGAERIYGYDAGEILGKPISVLAPPERHDEILRILERVGRGEKVEHHETLRVRKDGSKIRASVTVSPIRDAKGEIVGASAIARDTTERKRAEDEIRRLNEKLEGRVAERTERLAESERRLKELVGKLITAQEEERRRVAYEVHDGLTQVAIAAHQHLQVFADDHPPGSLVEEGDLDRALSLAKRVVREARHVIEDLRPTALDDFGLAAALRLEAEELTSEGWKIAYEDEGLGEIRLAPETETALYRVAQEALNNARKHAGVKEACMKLVRRPGKVRLEVTDEGRGFDPSSSSRNGGRGERVGLAGMRERVGLLGGKFHITSAPGSGTSVVVEVPLEAEDPAAKTPLTKGL